MKKESTLIVSAVILLIAATFFTANTNQNLIQESPQVRSIRTAGTQSGNNPINHPIPQLPGWPKQFGGEMGNPNLIEDIDNDGILELIVFESDELGTGNNALIHILDSHGNNKLGWPLVPIGNALGSHLSVGDVTGDGYKEIIGFADKRIFVYDYSGNLLPGWPTGQIGSFLGFHSSTLKDLNNNGIRDIIYAAGSPTGFPPDYLFAFNYSRNLLPGFRVQLRGESKAEVAVEDINLDGQSEIIVTSNHLSSTYNIDYLYLEVFSNVGTKLWEKSFPYNFSYRQQVPASIGNLDSDPELEIVFPSYDGNIYAFNHDGTLLSGWSPISVGLGFLISPVAIGDLDNDGFNEVIYYSNKLYVFENDGTLKWSKDQYQDFGGGYVRASPTISDIDGDGKMEVLVATESNPKIYAFNGEDGSLVSGFPLNGGPQLTSFQRSAPLITDFDLDGDVEIIAGGDDKKVYVWDLDSQYNAALVYWETLQQNSERTGEAI